MRTALKISEATKKKEGPDLGANRGQLIRISWDLGAQAPRSGRVTGKVIRV